MNPHDAIVRITTTAICGSDLHLYNGFVPSMKKGDVLGHEFMGEIEEVGPEVKHVRKGDRVVVPFPIACGRCNMCQRSLFSLCENTNPNAWMAEKLWGFSPAGIFGDHSPRAAEGRPKMYDVFMNKQDECMKVVLEP